MPDATVPPAIRPLDRGEIEEMIGGLNIILENLSTVPHSVALVIEREAGEIRAALEDCLPGGGPAAHCEGCADLMGQGEIAASDPENGGDFCADCVARFKAEGAPT